MASECGRMAWKWI